MSSFRGFFGGLLAGTQTLQVLFDARRAVGQRGLAEHTGGGRTGSRRSRLGCCRCRSSGLRRNGLGSRRLGCRGGNRGGRRYRNRLFCSCLCGRFHRCFFRHAGSQAGSHTGSHTGSRDGCLCRAGGKERGGRRELRGYRLRRCRLRGCRLGSGGCAHRGVLSNYTLVGLCNGSLSRGVCGSFGCLQVVLFLFKRLSVAGLLIAAA